MTSLVERAVPQQRVQPVHVPDRAGVQARGPRHARRPGPDDRFRVLVVCTGNICRSPAGELLMRHLLVGRLGGRAAGRVEVSSAGVRAVVGHGMHPLSRAQLAPWGLDSRADGFVARQLDDAVVDGVDLVLGANVRHRSAVLERHPELLDRTFALREFARLSAAVDAASLPSDLVGRGRALVEAARALRGTVPPADDTVPDPMGEPEQAHRDAVGLIFGAMHGIVDVLAPRQRVATG
ncbi:MULTISPECIES: low molecular weight phosphatase family protein [unclassified Pseudonocardia]|uniref:arsenate reductase/protein-tyrosine-phosphatase family protein n=1 Tax=unclassified Pseudonocardia TaxID=2619320 RepID=UPI0001FFE117|nr:MULTISPECIES: low molecular weight phosphatase family protein [unclassified Pseudonocardia]OLM20200.1 Low molecular weight protein-tyrosine-phosphatase Wzb [Pseudonocardia sp. Ae707_Ps1]